MSVSIRSVGRVKAVGISVSQSEIDWGLIGRGESKAVSVTVSNVNNTAVSLSMSTANWQPSNAESYFSLVWNSEGAVLQPGEQRQVTFVLSVANAEIPFGTFSFDIVVTATEVS